MRAEEEPQTFTCADDKEGPQMATLTPPSGSPYLKPAEVVRRMEAAFAYVEATPEVTRA